MDRDRQMNRNKKVKADEKRKEKHNKLVTYIGQLVKTATVTPYSRIILDKPIVVQLVKKCSANIGNHKVHCHVHKIPPLDPIRKYINLIQILKSCLFKIHFNIILPSAATSPK